MAGKVKFKDIEMPFDETQDVGDVVVADEVVDPAPEPAPAQEEPEYGKHIFVDVGGTGFYEMVHVNHPGLRGIDPKTGWNRDRQLFLHGQNIEHVGEGVNGVWCYRSM